MRLLLVQIEVFKNDMCNRNPDGGDTQRMATGRGDILTIY